MEDSMNLAKVKNHPVTVPAVWLGIIFIAGWQGPNWIERNLGDVFMPRAEAATHEEVMRLQEEVEQIAAQQQQMKTTMDSHLVDYRLATAIQLERTFRDDLKDWREHPEETASWKAHEKELVDRLSMASQYRGCIVADRTNCDNIRKQLLLQ